MYFKKKKIKGRIYTYAVKSIRLPDGKHVSLEKLYKHEPREELEKFFVAREKHEAIKQALSMFKTDSILTKETIGKVEEARVAYRKIIRRLTKTSLRDLFDRFTANFTYESNALEGNSLTLKDVAIVMFENASIKGKDLREIYETRNSRKVVDLIIRNKLSVSHKDILKMHSLLVKDLGIQAGYKTVPNIILGKNVTTTPPEKVHTAMDSLISWYDENKGKLHPLTLAAIFHGKFEQIHPFEDGNGRVGRFMINVILVKNKYPPLIIRNSQRLSYLAALEKFDQRHNDTLLRFIIEKYLETYKKFFEVYVRYV